MREQKVQGNVLPINFANHETQNLSRKNGREKKMENNGLLDQQSYKKDCNNSNDKSVK